MISTENNLLCVKIPNLFFFFFYGALELRISKISLQSLELE